MASPKEEAEKFEESARRFSKKASIMEGLRKQPRYYGEPTGYHEKIEEMHRKVSILYEKAAEEWLKTGKRNEALKDYRNYEEYAWTPEDKDRLSGIIEKLSQPRRPRSLFSILSIIFLLGSLFFISFSLTGNAIADLSKDNLTLAGTGMFVLGLVFVFFYIQEKKR